MHSLLRQMQDGLQKSPPVSLQSSSPWMFNCVCMCLCVCEHSTQVDLWAILCAWPVTISAPHQHGHKGSISCGRTMKSSNRSAVVSSRLFLSLAFVSHAARSMFLEVEFSGLKYKNISTIRTTEFFKDYLKKLGRDKSSAHWFIPKWLLFV